MRDSIDKIVTVYFACVTAQKFTYKGETYKPRKLKVSPLIFRGYTCPAGCGGCCFRFSLDYLPDSIESHPSRLYLKERLIEFNGEQVPIYSDLQLDHTDWHCKNVDQTNGRCLVHGQHPFSCDFELIRFLTFADQDRPNSLTARLYGRGWNLLRVDGERGALCEMTDADLKTKNEVVRKLKRLRTWCEYFGLDHKLDKIIPWAEKGPRATPLVV